MKKKIFFYGVLSLFLLSAVAYASVSINTDNNETALSKEEVSRKLSKLRIPFIENKGQMSEDVSFYAKTFGGTLFVTKDGGLVYALIKSTGSKEKGPSRLEAVRARAAGCVVGESFIEGKVSKVSGEKESVIHVSYFKGKDPNKWQKGLKTYEELSLGEIYKGIELRLRAHGNNVEKLFYVSPGASPDEISIKVEGAKSLKQSKDKSLVLETSLGEVSFTRPVAYQIIDGKKVEVEARYEVRKNNLYTFKLGKYDNTKELVIAPLLQSTYLGGSGGDYGWAIAIHPDSGDVYVTGYTYSYASDFPGVDGNSADKTFAGDTEAFVIRLDSSLTTLQSTYLGGSDYEFGYDIAIHPGSGDVYVTGYTYSSDFPGVDGNSADKTFAGDTEAFVIRLDSSLTTLQSTYLGGGSGDYGRSLSIHPDSGDVYVTGWTFSSDFPGVDENSADNTSAGDEAFVTRLDSSLTTLRSTYLGGGSGDYGYGLNIHPDSGDVYVTGWTFSSDFPGIDENSADKTFAGDTEAFVTRFDSSLIALQSTYLGGGSDDYGYGISIHPGSEDVYVTGWTFSSDFPGVDGNSSDKTFAGDTEAFVTRLDSSLTTLHSTYLGGGSDDYGYGLSIHPGSGDVYVTGWTFSSDFPGIDENSADNTSSGDEAFVTRLDSGLTTLRSTYLGGSDDDYGYGLSIHPGSGDVYVTGWTFSSDLPGVDGNSADNTSAGGEAFVTKFDSYSYRP